jgi:hypothetical protein
VTQPASCRLRRVDLAHGADHELVASAIVEDEAGSSFTAQFATEAALHAFLDFVLRYPGRLATVRMFLKPVGYRPAQELPIEFVPSSLYFDFDPGRGVAAAALLVLDAEGMSHQWLTRGEGPSEATLVMDPFNPDFSQFPDDSVVPISEVRDLVVHWAFGDEYPPSSAPLRRATEKEVGWPVGAAY